jgi:hypothetical protein
VLDHLHDGLEPNVFEVQIEVPDNSVAGCPCTGRFRSPDGRVSAGTVMGRCSGGTHHVHMADLDSKVPVDVAPILG